MISREDYAKRRSWGEALRRRRIEKKLSQTVVIVRAKISHTILASYERNAVMPTVFTASKILKVLDWTLEEWAEAAEEIYADGSWYNERFDHDYGYGDRRVR